MKPFAAVVNGALRVSNLDTGCLRWRQKKLLQSYRLTEENEQAQCVEESENFTFG